MRKYLLLALLISGCIMPAQQSGANRAAENYVRNMLNNPKNFESVSFSDLQKSRYQTALDSSMSNSHLNEPDNKRIEKYVDSENSVRPDLSTSNVNDMYNIEHGKLVYYTMIYTFRIDSGKLRKLKKYRLELDSANNVLNAKDIGLGSNFGE